MFVFILCTFIHVGIKYRFEDNADFFLLFHLNWACKIKWAIKTNPVLLFDNKNIILILQVNSLTILQILVYYILSLRLRFNYF